MEVGAYRYYEPSTCGLNWSGMMEDMKVCPRKWDAARSDFNRYRSVRRIGMCRRLIMVLTHGRVSQNLANGSAVLLHACAHNPTGVDLIMDQWAELSELFKVRPTCVLSLCLECKPKRSHVYAKTRPGTHLYWTHLVIVCRPTSSTFSHLSLSPLLICRRSSSSPCLTWRIRGSHLVILIATQQPCASSLTKATPSLSARALLRIWVSTVSVENVGLSGTILV